MRTSKSLFISFALLISMAIALTSAVPVQAQPGDVPTIERRATNNYYYYYYGPAYGCGGITGLISWLLGRCW